MEDRGFLKVEKYALNYLKSILPGHNLECEHCGAREYDIEKIYHILSNEDREDEDREHIVVYEDADSGEEITASEIIEEVLCSMWSSILESKDPCDISDEEWIGYYCIHCMPEEFLKKDGELFESDFGIITKLYKNVYFYTDETCGCLRIMGYRQHLRSK